MLAVCLHDLTALAPAGGVWALAGALFVMGLAGGATHCAGMCGPFVLAQSAALADRTAGGPFLVRLSGAALMPYHCGRMLGYALLGGALGGTAGLIAIATGPARPFLSILLALAALLMLAQASTQLRSWLPTITLPIPVLRGSIGRLLGRPRGWRGVLLGVLLSAMPCGLLYGALAASAAAGSALGGAVAMAAFAAGTIPALMGVGLLGQLFSRRFGPALRPVATMLLLANAGVLTAMAIRLASF